MNTPLNHIRNSFEMQVVVVYVIANVENNYVDDIYVESNYVDNNNVGDTT